MKFLFVSPFRMPGTGYTNITKQLALGLSDRGHDVMVLGIGYDKSEHNFPFRLVPTEQAWTFEQLRAMPELWKPDRMIVSNDVPYLNDLVKKFVREKEERMVWQFEAIFPVESDPLLPEWRIGLGKFKHRFVISRYGKEVCESHGLPAAHLPIGCAVGKQPSNKSGPRQLLEWPEDAIIFLSVTDNHERKALPLALQAFSYLPEDAHYYMLTNPDARLGWSLLDLAQEYGVQDRFHVVRPGVSQGILSTMYWAADALVVPSQAEGACLPVYEAAAHGLPVICGNWTALRDVQGEAWVIPVRSEYEYRYPWGNVRRWFASVTDLSDAMMTVYRQRLDSISMTDEALTFARQRSWSQAVDVVEGAG